MQTQLTAINWAKVITIAVIIGLSLFFGINGQRQILYACMHISYCLWWLLEQKIYPERRKQIFTEKVDAAGFIGAIIIVGIFYSLPAFLAFTNPTKLSIAATATAIPLFYFGSLINTAADIQKTTEKASGVGLVRSGIWSGVRHVNYAGDLMRYFSFSVVAGSLWAFLVPLSIFFLYIQRIRDKESSMKSKYQDFSDYKSKSFYLIPGIWWEWENAQIYSQYSLGRPWRPADGLGLVAGGTDLSRQHRGIAMEPIMFCDWYICSVALWFWGHQPTRPQRTCWSRHWPVRTDRKHNLVFSGWMVARHWPSHLGTRLFRDRYWDSFRNSAHQTRSHCHRSDWNDDRSSASHWRIASS